MIHSVTIVCCEGEPIAAFLTEIEATDFVAAPLHEHECIIRVRNHDEYVDASCISEGGWGVVVNRGFYVRPPGTPIALPLAAHAVMFNADFTGSVTVEPSINYDEGGPYAWHGWLRASQWVPA